MTVEIKVPAMGESVTEATISKWFKKEGDAVKRDEPLLELETDKVTVEVPSPADGAIESINAQAGATVQVGALLGAIAEGKAGSAPAAKPAAAPKAEAPKPAVPAPAPAAAKADAPAMPSAKRISEESGIALSSVAGTGRDGRVTKGDMLGALEARSSAPAAPAAAAPAGPRHNEAREERVAMTRLRKTIALRLKESQNTAAQLTTFNEVDMTAVMGLRSTYKDVFEKKHGVKMGFMGFFTKAVVAAL
jgi:2-oxoglutarate dehydrogenase E2 component (dihydrolipoamide succinyltransferase)